MAPELVDLTDDSPPASPKTPTATVRTSVGSSSAPAEMQNQHQPWPGLGQQPQPLPKRLRSSTEQIMGTRNRSRSPPAQLRLVRSSSENNITRSGTQPILDYDRLQGTLSKVHLTEAEHKLSMKQKGSSVPMETVNCTTRADNAGSSLMPDGKMKGPGDHISTVIGSSSTSKKPVNVVSQVTSGELLLKIVSESALNKQIAHVPTPLATIPPMSVSLVISPPTQIQLASASVQPASLALPSSPPLPTTLVMITHPMSAPLISATHPIPAPPLTPSPPVPDPYISAQPMPTSVASIPPVIAPLMMALPVPAPLLSTPPTPARLVWYPPPLVSAPLMWTASWQMPDTLKLFPVETSFFPMVSERGSSSNAGKGDNVNLSVYRDDPAIKPGHMSWILATPEANVMVEYEQVPVVSHNGGDYGNVDDEVDLDLSL